MAQPQGALAKALLEPGQSFEPEFVKEQIEKKKSAPEGETYPGPESAEFYDYTGWSLPLAHGLKAFWCEAAPRMSLYDNHMPHVVTHEPGRSPIGYALEYRDQDDILAVADALSTGVRGMVSTKPMSLGGESFPRGSFIFLSDHNDEGFEEALFKAAQFHGSTLRPLTTEFPDGETRTGPGSDSTLMLRAPTIGVAFGNGANLASVGGIWYLMDREFHLPFTPLASSALSSGDLSKYTALVVPGGAGVTASTKLKDWVSAGGSLVILQPGGWALGSSGFVSLDSGKGDLQDLPGALFKAELDPRSFLSYGYEAPAGGGKIPLAVPIAGSSFYEVRKEGGSVLSLASDEKESKLLSGWEWPDETEKALAGTVVVQDVPLGRGHVVIFFTDPTDRAMWPGLYKILLNALILGSAR
jgi:hypothetical protein